MNNSFFSLVRYLRDEGVQADLLLFENETPHFRPDCDTVNRDHDGCIRQLAWGRADHFASASAAEIRSVLDGYSKIIGCGPALAYFHKGGRPADLFIPYGDDLIQLPYGRTKKLKRWKKTIYNKILARSQKRGIREAKAIITEWEMHREFIEAIGYPGRTFDHHFPAVYDYVSDLLPLPEHLVCDVSRLVDKVRAESAFVVFHQARHIWCSRKDEQSQKGNDKLIRGFADFVSRSGERSAKLVLLEYGPDVAESRSLISRLSIDDHVVWLPLSPRKLILYGILNSDVATGHFGLPCNLNGVTQEGLICGRPLLHRREDARLDDRSLAALYPVCDVSTSEEISEALIDLYSDPRKRQEMGSASREWYTEVFTPRFFDRFWESLGGQPQDAARADRARGCDG